MSQTCIARRQRQCRRRSRVVLSLSTGPQTTKYGTTENRSANQVVKINAVTKILSSVPISTYLSIEALMRRNSSPIGGQVETVVGRRRADTTVGSTLGTTSFPSAYSTLAATRVLPS